MAKAKHQREKIIELHDKQGMTFPEIAKTLNMSLSTTYNVYRYGNGHGKKDVRYRETVRVPQKRLFVYKGKAYWDITDYFMGV